MFPATLRSDATRPAQSAGLNAVMAVPSYTRRRVGRPPPWSCVTAAHDAGALLAPTLPLREVEPGLAAQHLVEVERFLAKPCASLGLRFGKVQPGHDAHLGPFMASRRRMLLLCARTSSLRPPEGVHPHPGVLVPRRGTGLQVPAVPGVDAVPLVGEGHLW